MHRLIHRQTKGYPQGTPCNELRSGAGGGRGSPANAGRHHTIRHQNFDLEYLDIIFISHIS